MRRSRLAELRRARPVAWLNALRTAAVGPCWRTTAEGRATVAALAEALEGRPAPAGRHRG
ncbi:hypothetical protein [Streptomyces sp. CAU 1734]|uniref:hypothetical protein n=1 Tax=Streptomyces sp. CAU 1734 TaxID=3140360 RepID=UPI00326162EF